VSNVAIRCRSLVKRYGKQAAVDGIDLEVSTGECFGLLGPNGAGKTTTVEILEGLTRPDSGSATLFDIAWGRGRDQELRERIGVQLQETQLGDKLRVVEVFELFRSFYRHGRAVDELIALLDLAPEREKHYSKLSGGQKQRVALGCALVGKPDLLFLDEPTTGLDPRARRAIWGVVERFRAEGGTVLITTHHMEEATALCDRIAIMDRGRIIALDTPRALVDGLGLVQFVEFEVSSPLDEAALGAFAAVASVEKRRERYRLRVDRSLSALRAVLAELERQNVVPIGLSTHQATLDDVFLQLTGRALATEPAENGEARDGANGGSHAA
jgi:ABC-2 type transport system ATP-binding protein